MSRLTQTMVVSIIGRPNVGKSTIFNRLMKKSSKAMTHDIPGVTRDRHYGVGTIVDEVNSDSLDYILVDTGGFYPEKVELTGVNKEEKFFNLMAAQAEMAIDESDHILFIVDGREGLLPFDQQISEFLRGKKKTFWILVNKMDTHKQDGEEAEFYQLGIDSEDLIPVSASHGVGFLRLDSKLLELAKGHRDKQNARLSTEFGIQKGVCPKEDVISKLALIGAPNAGKSTLLNKLLGAKRALVSDIAGTTVDPIEGYFDIYFGKDVSKVDKFFKGHKNNHEFWGEFEKLLVDEETGQIKQECIDKFDVSDMDLESFQDEDDDDDANGEQFETLSDDAGVDHKVENILGDAEACEVAEEVSEVDAGPCDKSNGSYWRSLLIVDTAGIRRKKSVCGEIENQSIYRSLRSIQDSEIVLILVDATQGISHQDRRLADIALEKGKSIIICLNKIDLLKDKLKTSKAQNQWLEELRVDIPWLGYVELVPLSAKYGSRVNSLKEAIKRTVIVRNSQVPTSRLNDLIGHMVETHPVTLKDSRGKRFKVKYASQVKANPPTFLLFTNKGRGIPANYRRYLQNGIRREFSLYNTPVHLIFRSGKEFEKKLTT
ncbi:MAG: ribosome-associated GTPase EngA [Bacteriovoracaceae bacterium]|jgi:GTPase|nr:ribosome-associated GTPase EngA [Bacteriovoracaceae bacterium]